MKLKSLCYQACLLLAVLFISQPVLAQNPPFYNEIQAFKKKDSVQMPPKQAILFVGSSSIRMWKNLQQDFPTHTVINRGFGGSTLPDVIRYADDIIFPYQPKQIVIFCGENDLASSDTIQAITVANRFKTLFNLIRSKMPNVPIVYITAKPSPSREKYMPKILAANVMIKDFLKKKRKAVYVDTYHKMLDENGKPIPGLFLPDMLHMNEKGYAIWTKAVEPHLIK